MDENDYEATAKVFQEVEDAFSELASIQKNMERIFNCMKTVEPLSEEHNTLEREFNEQYERWDFVYGTFTNAQVRFLACMSQGNTFLH